MSVEFDGKPIENMTRAELVDALASIGIKESDLGSGYVAKSTLLETLEFALVNDDEAYAEMESGFEFLDEEDIEGEHEAAIEPAKGERV